MLQWFHSSQFTVVVQIDQHNCNYHQSIYVTVATLCILRHSYKHMCRMWCMSWHLSTTISPLTARGAVLLAATFDELATRSWIIRSTAHFGFHPLSVLFNTNLHGWVVSFGDTWIGLLHGHLDTLLVWFTRRVLLFVGGKFSCAQVFLCECSLPCEVLFWHSWCSLAWLFCHIRAQKIYMWQHHSMPNCQCISVDWQFSE